MGLFGKIVKTAINVGIGLPVAVVKDTFTLGNSVNYDQKCFIAQKLEQIKEEADD